MKKYLKQGNRNREDSIDRSGFSQMKENEEKEENEKKKSIKNLPFNVVSAGNSERGESRKSPFSFSSDFSQTFGFLT